MQAEYKLHMIIIEHITKNKNRYLHPLAANP